MKEETEKLHSFVLNKYNELNYKINMSILKSKKSRTKKIAIENIIRINRESLERRLSSLPEEEINLILNDYKNYIELKEFFHIYLDTTITRRCKYKKGYDHDKRFLIFNNKNFIVSDLSLVENPIIPELYYMLSPNRITGIIEKLLNKDMNPILSCYKIYEALNFYYPNNIDFWKKTFYYNNMIVGNEKEIFKIKKYDKAILEDELMNIFNITISKTSGVYLFMFFTLVKMGKSIRKIKRILTNQKECDTFSLVNIYSFFEQDKYIEESKEVDELDIEYFEELLEQEVTKGIDTIIKKYKFKLKKKKLKKRCNK